jgi:hypothetical protein
MDSTLPDGIPPSAPPQPDAAAPARRRIRLPRAVRAATAGAAWRKALREFAVIVAGVMAAQGAQAWWGARQDSERERDYLRQLLADTRANEQRLTEAIGQDSVAGVAASRAIDALTAATAPPPGDSLAAWVLGAGASSNFRPLAGTFQALLGTGDLRLVRNDSVRARIAAYATSLNGENERQRDLREAMIRAAGPFAREFPFVRRVFLGGVGSADVNVRRLRGDPDAVAVLFAMQAANANRLAGLRGIREETRAVRRVLEAEPALRET